MNRNRQNHVKRAAAAILLSLVLLPLLFSCGMPENGESAEAERAPETGITESNIETDTDNEEETEMNTKKLKLQIGDTVLTASLAQNSTVDALLELLDEQLTLEMEDYGGFEKGAPLPESLPQNNEPMNTDAGDIILYQGRQFVIYYDTNSWSLTPVAKIEGISKAELQDLLGDGDVTVTFWAE